MLNSETYIAGGKTVSIDGRLRTSGLLAHLAPENLQTLICLLTYADRKGRCSLSDMDVSECLDLSQKQGRERLRRLSQVRFNGKPLIADESGGRNVPSHFARVRFRILPLPGVEIGSGGQVRGNWGGSRATSTDRGSPVLPGETVRFSGTPERLGKLSSGTPGSAAKGSPGNTAVVVNNKATQDTEGDMVNSKGGEEPDSLMELLRSQGVTEMAAREMVGSYPPERILRQVKILPFRDARDPAAMLVKAVREDWGAPASYAAAVRERTMRSKAEKAASEREKKREAHEQLVEKALSKLSPEELGRVTQRAREKVKASLNGALGKRIPQSLVEAQVKKIISEEHLNEPNRKKEENDK